MHPFIALQRLLPQHALSRTLGWFANSRQHHLKTLLINAFAAAYHVDFAECEGSGADDFATFNDFFTRQLRSDTRPIASGEGAIACPADGTVSQAGPIEQGTLLQAKGHAYSLADLLGDASWAATFAGGSFATIYLAPHNYHRVHAPCAARLVGTLEVPGRLFSVNALTERNIAGLFVQNERLVLRFEAAFGEVALVLVGALIVASIEAAWPDGPTSPYRRQRLRSVEDVAFQRGDEVGAFLIGSTVVAVFPPAVRLKEGLRHGAMVRMGELVGHAAPACGLETLNT